jgi:hypothetical protein
MDQNHSDNLPPELDELGKRMSMESPVASDRTLDRVMTRAEGARRPRKSSFLWRSSAPRAGRRGLAVAVAGVMAMAGMTGVAVMGATAQIDSTPSELSCPSGVVQLVPIVGDLVQACVSVLPFAEGADAVCPPGAIQIDVDLGSLTQTCATVLVGEDNLIDLPIGGTGGGGSPLDSLTGALGGLGGGGGGGGGGGLGGGLGGLSGLLSGLLG